MATVTVFPEKYKYVYQNVVVFAAHLFHMAAVITFAWPSPSLPKLLAPGGPFQITVDQGTWIVSFMKLGQFVGTVLAACLMDRIGRNRTILCAAIPLCGAWIMLALAESFELVCVYTFLGGFSFAVSFVVLPMYVAEISCAHIRGSLGIIHTITGKTGILFMFVVGPFTSVRTMAWLCTIPIGLFIAIYFWLPESPYHLIASNQCAAAEVSLKKLRCKLDVKEELAQMEESVKVSMANRGTFRELFFHPRNRQSIILVLGLSALIELCGSQIIVQYAQTIFNTLNTGLDPSICSIIFGVAQLLAAILASFLVDTMGRRPLMLISIVGSGVCTMVIGVYFVLERHTDVTGLGWLPVTAIMVFMITYTIGILALITVIGSEIFPKHLKSVAAATMGINGSWIGLVLVSAYQYGVDEWGSDYVFIAFSLVTFAFVPFVLIMLPETKRLTLDSILQTN